MTIAGVQPQSLNQWLPKEARKMASHCSLWWGLDNRTSGREPRVVCPFSHIGLLLPLQYELWAKSGVSFLAHWSGPAGIQYCTLVWGPSKGPCSSPKQWGFSGVSAKLCKDEYLDVQLDLLDGQYTENDYSRCPTPIIKPMTTKRGKKNGHCSLWWGLGNRTSGREPRVVCHFSHIGLLLPLQYGLYCTVCYDVYWTCTSF